MSLYIHIFLKKIPIPPIFFCNPAGSHANTNKDV